MPPLTGLHHFAGDVLQLCRAYGAVLRVASPAFRMALTNVSNGNSGGFCGFAVVFMGFVGFLTETLTSAGANQVLERMQWVNEIMQIPVKIGTEIVKITARVIKTSKTLFEIEMTALKIGVMLSEIK